MVSFLRKTICTFYDSYGGSNTCKIQHNYQDAPEVTLENILLLPDHRTYKVPWLDTIREPFLHNMTEQIRLYFPSGKLRDFDIFEPSNIPSDSGASAVYGLNEVHSFCEFFEWDDCNALGREWTFTIRTIIESSRFCELHTSNALTFWSQMLKTNDIAWTVRTNKLIHTILVLPIGSAEAERGFSIMNHILTSRRMSLTPEHVDDLMRLRLNGPEKIE